MNSNKKLSALGGIILVALGYGILVRSIEQVPIYATIQDRFYNNPTSYETIFSDTMSLGVIVAILGLGTVAISLILILRKQD